MSPLWSFIGDMLSATWGVEGFIKMNANGSSLAQVRAEYVNLWLLAAFYLVAGYCLRRWVMRPSLQRAGRSAVG